MAPIRWYSGPAPRPVVIAQARAALGFRRQCWAVLVEGGSAVETLMSVDANAAAWRLFLATERCAVPLLDALGGRLPVELRDAAARESVSVLAARAQAVELGEAARARGLQVILLKGGAELFDSEPAIALGDVDVLVALEDLEPAREMVGPLGYEVREHGATFRHDPLYRRPGGIPLELHTSIDKYGARPEPGLFERAEPVEGSPGLYRLSPADQAWHVLLHATEGHLHRRGRIRDLLLLARVLRRVTDEARQVIERRAGSHAYSRAVLEHLRMAQDMRAGRVPEDAFEAEAAALYLTYGWLRRSRKLSDLLLPTAADAPAALLAYGPEFRDLWLDIGRFPDGMSPYRGVAGVEQAVPMVGRIVRVVGRVFRLVIGSAAALLVTPLARHLAAEN